MDCEICGAPSSTRICPMCQSELKRYGVAGMALPKIRKQKSKRPKTEEEFDEDYQARVLQHVQV